MAPKRKYYKWFQRVNNSNAPHHNKQHFIRGTTLSLVLAKIRDSLVDYLKTFSFSLRLSQSVCVCVYDRIDSYVSYQKKKKKKIAMYRKNFYIKRLTI